MPIKRIKRRKKIEILTKSLLKKRRKKIENIEKKNEIKKLKYFFLEREEVHCESITNHPK